MKKIGLSISELLEVNYSVPKAPLKSYKLIFAEIEGLNSIHNVLSRKNPMFLANQIKEILDSNYYTINVKPVLRGHHRNKDNVAL
jgi:hypothetical protein